MTLGRVVALCRDPPPTATTSPPSREFPAAINQPGRSPRDGHALAYLRAPRRPQSLAPPQTQPTSPAPCSPLLASYPTPSIAGAPGGRKSSSALFLLPASYFLLPASCSPLLAPCSLLPAACSLLLAPCFLLPASCSLLLAPCFLLLASYPTPSIAGASGERSIRTSRIGGCPKNRLYYLLNWLALSYPTSKAALAASTSSISIRARAACSRICF